MERYKYIYRTSQIYGTGGNTLSYIPELSACFPSLSVNIILSQITVNGGIILSHITVNGGAILAQITVNGCMIFAPRTLHSGNSLVSFFTM